MERVPVTLFQNISIFLITAFWTALELLALLFLAGAFLPKKSKWSTNFRIMILLAFWIALSIYPNLLENKLLKLAITLCLWSFILYLLYEGSFLKKTGIAVLYYAFNGAIDTGCIFGAMLLLQLDFTGLALRKVTYLSVIGFSKFLTVFLMWAVAHFRKKKKMQDISGQQFLLIFTYPLLSSVMLAILIFRSGSETDLNFSTFLFGIALIIANAGILYIINDMDKTARQTQEMMLLRQQNEMQTRNYQSLDTAYSAQRKVTHDFKRHIQIVYDLLKQGEYSAAEDYLSRLQSDRSLSGFCVHSQHPVIDVILNQKYQMALENDITMQIQINDLHNVLIPVNYLTVILSNLLDNAIEACQKLPSDKRIICTILLQQKLFISVRNTSVPVTIIDNKIATTKKCSLEHGYGIPAVECVLDQLHAEYALEYKNGWFQFAAEIPMQ